VRLAVLADIHSNLEALETTLAAAARLRVDRVACCGDLVGYNADPNAVIARARDAEMVMVMGNHDAVASGLEEPIGFNPVAKAAALWTREALTPENRAFLQGLPAHAELEGSLLLVHGSFLERDAYLLEGASAEGDLRALEDDYPSVIAAFFGHTHLPVAFSMGPDGERVETDLETRVRLEAGRRYLINPGSVGQPRDGDPRLSFVVVDLGAGRVERHRRVYPVAKTARKVREAGLPDFLADRLERGH
jgi:diadenosine tetraphosphatase ApaH/serine/threonine PP2A family protein phosphatase